VTEIARPNAAALAAFRARFEASPTWRAFGQRITELDAGGARVEADLEAFTNVMGSVHGGVLGVLADSAMAVAIRTVVGIEPLVVTVEMKVTFLAKVDAPHVVADARVVKSGSQLAFAEARLTSASGALVATASATFAIRRPTTSGASGEE
jgi:uncharacterized protein (TIGR00369 family)